MLLAGILAIVFVLGAALGLYAFFAPRRKASRLVAAPPEPLQTQTGWTNAAGAEFSGLPESARCDMIFAVAALDDDRSRQLLEHALGDPSEAVALAAAHALATRSCTAVVDRYLDAHPGARSQRIAETLALLRPEA